MYYILLHPPFMSSHRPVSDPQPSSTLSHHHTSTPTPTQLRPLRTNTSTLGHTRSDTCATLTTAYVHFHSIHVADLPCFDLHDPRFPAFTSLCAQPSTLSRLPSTFNIYAFLPSHIQHSCKPKGIRGLHAQRAFHEYDRRRANAFFTQDQEAHVTVPCHAHMSRSTPPSS